MHLLLFLALAVFALCCSGTDDRRLNPVEIITEPANASRTLEQLVCESEGLSTVKLKYLSELMRENGELFRYAERGQPFTFFAPSDDAFLRGRGRTVPHGVLPDPEPESTLRYLADVLPYHTVRGRYTAQELFGEQHFPETYLTKNEYADLYGRPQVIVPIMHDDVGYIETGCHEQTFITREDMEFDGGIMHIVNEFFRLPQRVSETAKALEREDSMLSNYLKALNRSSLAAILDQTANATVFVPRFDYGAKLTPIQAVDLVASHTVENMVLRSADLLDGMQLKTVYGNTLNVTVDAEGTRYINKRMITTRDIIASTGVMHVLWRQVCHARYEQI